jgi:hypothetical protein
MRHPTADSCHLRVYTKLVEPVDFFGASVAWNARLPNKQLGGGFKYLEY